MSAQLFTITTMTGSLYNNTYKLMSSVGGRAKLMDGVDEWMGCMEVDENEWNGWGWIG